MKNSIIISIAEFIIELNAEIPIKLESGYLPFLCKSAESKPDIKIDCMDGFPDIISELGTPVFEAENEFQKFYSIYQNNDDLLFAMYNQQNINQLQQIAVLNSDLSAWKLYCKPEADGFYYPLKYPFGPIMMHYLTQKTGSAMMHASCVYDGKVGRIFTGFSGNGKSTMADIWNKNGCTVINDDRIIIRQIDGQIFAFNTPMFYPDKPKKAPVKFVYLISHSPENKIKKLSGAAALSRSMAFFIQNNFDKKQINNQFNFFNSALEHLQVFELGFVPDEKVINFVVDNENHVT